MLSCGAGRSSHLLLLLKQTQPTIQFPQTNPNHVFSKVSKASKLLPLKAWKMKKSNSHLKCFMWWLNKLSPKMLTSDHFRFLFTFKVNFKLQFKHIIFFFENIILRWSFQFKKNEKCIFYHEIDIIKLRYYFAVYLVSHFRGRNIHTIKYLYLFVYVRLIIQLPFHIFSKYGIVWKFYWFRGWRYFIISNKDIY